MKRLISLPAVLCVMALAVSVAWAGVRFVTIGTGGVTGVYYPTGGAISKLVNQKQDVYGLKVTFEATGGSVFNINAVLTGDMDLGLAQSDRVAQAWNGEAEWKAHGPQKKLRGVFTLHSETVCLIAAADSGIRTCSDLKGKIVAVGNPGSGTLRNSVDALATCGLGLEDLGQAEGIKAAEGAGLLQDGRLDAYFYTVGHPNGSLKEAAAGMTPVRFIALPNVDALVKRKPSYTKAVIPIDYYPGVQNDTDVPTFGMKACLITSETVPEAVIYAITKEVFENFDTFRTLHPAFEKLTRQEMVRGFPMPLHAGAITYFKEAGLMK